MEFQMKLKRFLKQETVLSVAAILAVLSMFFVPPDADYLGYIDLRTLRCVSETDAPSTPFFITAAIPLIPGSTLYYCMNAVVSNDLSAAGHFGEQTFLAALGIAGGMAIAWCLADLSRKLHALAIRSSGKQ